VRAVGSSIDQRDMRSRGLQLYAVGLKPDLIASVRPALLAVGAAGTFLLLVLAVNLATVLLARAAQREREFGVSRALGASRAAIVRSTVLEGGALGVLGGAGGVALALAGTRALVGLAPSDLPRLETIVVTPAIAGSVVLAGALLGLLAGLIPAVWSTRIGLDVLLGSAAVRGGGGGRGRLRAGMVALQVALSLTLLSAGALVARSFERLLRAEPGFITEGVLTFRMTPPTASYPEVEDLQGLNARLAEALAAVPGVRTVGASRSLPLQGEANQNGVRFLDAPGNNGVAEHDGPLVDVIQATPAYFETIGVRLLTGNVFGARADDPAEVMIDRALAERFFPGGANPVGSRMTFGSDTLAVAGVIQQPRLYDVHRDGREQVYVRYVDYPSRTLAWAIRTDRDPESLVPDVRAVVRRVDPELALESVRSLDQLVAGSLQQQRLSAVMIGAFSLGALLLAAMGLFGVVSGAVARRRHEIAVRLALGAEQGGVVRLVLWDGARLVVLGLLLGGPGVYLAGRSMRAVLIEVSPFDPPTLLAVAVGLALVTLAACYLPARRAVGIEPAKTLRQE
jgi:putative ABC transport system permease protein